MGVSGTRKCDGQQKMQKEYCFFFIYTLKNPGIYVGRDWKGA